MSCQLESDQFNCSNVLSFRCDKFDWILKTRKIMSLSNRFHLRIIYFLGICSIRFLSVFSSDFPFKSRNVRVNVIKLFLKFLHFLPFLCSWTFYLF